MPSETPRRLVRELTSRGFNAEPEAVTLLAGADTPDRALEAALETVPEDAMKLTAAHVRSTLETGGSRTQRGPRTSDGSPSDTAEDTDNGGDRTPTASAGTNTLTSAESPQDSPLETQGSGDGHGSPEGEGTTAVGAVAESVDEPDIPRNGETATATTNETVDRSTEHRAVTVDNDMTGRSTGTGEYGDFVDVFRDRYERLSRQLRGRVNHRPTNAVAAMAGGTDAAIVGMISDIRSTASGHWLIELEDTNGTFPCLVMKDRPFADVVDELLFDEVIAVEGTLADDAGILFVDTIHFPDVPRTHQPSTADRHVQAALISDVHVGSQEFMADAWRRFADWLHTPEAATVEYLLIAGDMVEGVGVYPDQDEELDVVDIYDQYERFAEYLKAVPGDVEIRMIPGNHDAVRLAEPQPAFDEELRAIMSAHDASIHSNPSVVTIEGVSVLMYHGVSLDEVIAELPEGKASYDEPHKAMYQLLKKRHLAPQFGGKTRLAPEAKDYLVIEEVPDVFHTGHVHKLGWGQYHNVLAINSGCWQAQTAFQRSVNIDPDAGFAPILDLDTLEMTVRKFT